MFSAPALAQDATWLLNPGSADFNTAANWSPATVPTGTAFFGTSNQTTIDVFSSPNTNIGGFTFNPGASAYNFTVLNSLTFTGAGITINGGSATFTNAFRLNFNNASTAGSATINNNNVLAFNNSATAGSSTIVNNDILQFFNGTSAGSSTLTNNNNTSFFATSTAGSANIINNSVFGFFETSTAGSANITNNQALNFSNSASAGTATITNNSVVSFFNSSTAGNANITNNGGTIFQNNSSAGSATFVNNSGGVINLFNSATAASAQITNNADLLFNDTTTAGTATITNSSILSFFNSSTAAGANITNNNHGQTQFNNSSTAGNATITNNTNGTIRFLDNSTAGNANITNNGGAFIEFMNSSTAGSATIANNGGFTEFRNSSTAGSATITIASGGQLQFIETSTAGNATIINQSLNPLLFFDNSTAGNARLINGSGIIGFFTSGPNGDNKLSAGSIEGGGFFLLNANQLTVGSNNLSTIVSGQIGDFGRGGSLVKVGTGTLTLSGNNDYTGATIVNGGRLEVDGSIASSPVSVNAGGTLSGTGTVIAAAVNNGGALAPGNALDPTGQFQVTGNLAFQSGALYLVTVSGVNASMANANNASLAGTVQVTAVGSVTGGQTYDILHSAGPVVGTFDGVQASGFKATLSYSTTDVFLNLTANLGGGGGGGLTGNQQTLANNINSAFNSGGTLPAGFVNLFNLSGPALSSALTQVSGETATAAQQTTFDAMGQFMGLLTDPFMNRGGGFGTIPGATGYAEENAYAAKSNPTDAFAFVKAPLSRAYDPRWSVWVSGFGGSQSTSGNAAAGSNDTTSRIAGTAVGADYLVSPNTIAGFALAGGGTNFSVANGGGGRSDLFQIGAYIRHNQGPAYISAALAYGWQDITTSRTVTVAGFDQLRAQFNANAWSGRLEGGYRFVQPWIGGVGITPYAAAQFVTFDLPAYAEQSVVGTGAFALGYGAHDATDVRTELGFRTDKSWAQSDGILALRGRVAWAHDFDPDRSIAATFQALPGASFVVNGAAQAADSALTTVSIEKRWRNGWSAAATFEGEFSRVTESYAGKGVLRYAW